jgi:hypothetical protein
LITLLHILVIIIGAIAAVYFGIVRLIRHCAWEDEKELHRRYGDHLRRD